MKKPRAQDDFYQYINGEWLNKQTIPADQTSYGNVSILRKAVSNQLAEIIDEQKGKNNHIALLASLDKKKDYSSRLNSVIELTVGIQSAQTAEEFAFALGKLHAKGLGALWDIYIDVDELDPDTQLLRTYQSGLSLGDKDRYTLVADSSLRSAYRQYLKELAALPELKTLSLDHGEVWKFELALAEASFSTIENRDLPKLYNVYKLADWKSSIDFPWASYAKGLGYDTTKRLCIDQVRVISFVADQLKLNLYGLKQHVIHEIVLRLTPIVDGRIYDIYFDFFGVAMNGQKQPKPRRERRSGLISSCVPELVGEQYLSRYFPSAARRKMEEMVADLKVAFDHRLDKLDWITDKDKAHARKKLANFRVQIGGPEQPDNYIKLDLENINSIVDAKILSNVYHIRRELGKADGPIVETWPYTASTVNACIDFGLAMMSFPAGFLQPPFFDLKATLAENYGAIGSVIGHELTHGFDDMGAQYNADRRRTPWQSQQMKKKFASRASRFVEFINKHEVLPGLFLKGKLVMGESIADLGGVLIAYDALEVRLKRDGMRLEDICKDGLSHAQVFFQSFTISERSKSTPEFIKNITNSDPHPESSFRANGTLKHVDAFYDAYYVKKGDAMYLAQTDRVHIW